MATTKKTAETVVVEGLENEIIKNVEEQVEIIKSSAPENTEEKKPLTDADFDREAKKWGKIYAKEPKRKIKIYLPKDSKDTSPVPVIINGYSYFINKGETVEVPETVAKILENANYI